MKPLSSSAGALAAGLVLAVAVVAATRWAAPAAGGPAAGVLLVHVAAASVWIGLLWYYNLVHAPAAAAAARDADGPGSGGIARYVTPRLMTWWRYSALVAWLAGFGWLALEERLAVFALGLTAAPVRGSDLVLGLGVWLATLMLANLWLVIWPGQRIADGLEAADAPRIMAARRTALVAARINLALSVPVLACMVAVRHGFPL
jgi:uncharacterized membrane protein